MTMPKLLRIQAPQHRALDHLEPLPGADGGAAGVSPAAWAITMLSQMGIAIIACLSYNMLLGQGGMLSFGHAVYTGLGSFLAIHALNAVAARAHCRSRSADAAGGRPGRHVLCRAAGLRDHQKSGTTFAMITLGMGELVFAMSLMFPSSSAARAASRATG
jgi:branched-chain amino acid transport system permease protein